MFPPPAVVGNYTVGWIVINGSDPTQILARHKYVCFVPSLLLSISP